MEKAELQKEWERRIAVFKTSGQTQVKWCATNDLKVQQLKYGEKRFKDLTQNKSQTINGLL